MSNKYREIITKAVVGKGRKFSQSTYTISPPHHPSSILGCWIINHRYEAEKQGNKIVVHGAFDVNVWYSFGNNTKTEVVTETLSYTDHIKLKYRDENFLDDDCDVIVEVLQQPNCLECTISPNGNKILVEVERELLAEIIGETKVCVHVNPDGCYDDFKDWDVDDDEFEDLNPDFLVGDLEE